VEVAQASGAPPEKTVAATTAKAASEILMRITPEMSVRRFLALLPRYSNSILMNTYNK
jgi:hypothetical protein